MTTWLWTRVTICENLQKSKRSWLYVLSIYSTNMETLTLIMGLPWVGKSTLWDTLESQGNQIAHCDYDKVFEAILKNPKALSQIGVSYIPERERLPFLIWDTRWVVQTLVSDKMAAALFQGAVFEWSMQLLRTMQETKKRTFWVISLEASNKLSREIIVKQSQISGYAQVDGIEIVASSEELFEVARKRSPSIIIPDGKPKKAGVAEVKEKIQGYQPYQEKEKLFQRFLRIPRADLQATQVASWIVSR